MRRRRRRRKRRRMRSISTSEWQELGSVVITVALKLDAKSNQPPLSSSTQVPRPLERPIRRRQRLPTSISRYNQRPPVRPFQTAPRPSSIISRSSLTAAMSRASTRRLGSLRATTVRNRSARDISRRRWTSGYRRPCWVIIITARDRIVRAAHTSPSAALTLPPRHLVPVKWVNVI
jgi:hypothetical protein